MGGGETTAAASAFLENFGNVAVSKIYTCTLCGKEGFRSVEEFGTHAAICFGDNNASNNKTPLNNGMGAVPVAVLDEVWHWKKNKTVPGSVKCLIF